MREKKLFPHPTNRGYVYKLYHKGDDMKTRWNVSYYEDGKRKQRYGKINTGKSFFERYAYAQELIASLIEEHRAKIPPNEVRVRADRFLEMNQPEWAPKTLQLYKQAINEYFIPLEHKVPNDTYTHEHLLELKKKLHPNTYNKRITVLRRVLKEVGFGWLMDGVKRAKKVSSTPSRYFQSIHRRHIVEVLKEKDPQLLLFCRFIYQSFLRPTEVTNLRASDIIWDRKNIRVTPDNAKNSKFDMAPIPDVFMPILEANFGTLPPDAWLFSTRKPYKSASGHVSYNNMGDRWRKLIKPLGYGKGFDLYSWRHTAAVNAWQNGIGIFELQHLMRHSSISVTVQYMKSLGIKDMKNYINNAKDIDD